MGKGIGYLELGIRATSLAKDDSSFVRFIELPSSEPFDTARSWRRVEKPLIYVISDKDLYDVFGYHLAMKFQDTDFSTYHILGLKQNEEWIWMLRNNQKAFHEIVYLTRPSGLDPLPDSKRRYCDTLIRSVNGTKTAKWYTTGHGDCHARFDYKLFTDNHYPVLLLKEWNHWGGCRAGGSKMYTINFAMPPGISYSLKNTILAEKEYH